MKKTVVLGIVVLALAGGGLFLASSPRGVSVAGIDLGGTERAWLAERSIDFVEDLQFKDFKKASTYHLAKAQTERDIPEMLHKIFQVRHEVLDIYRYEVIDVDLDRSKTRARVRIRVWFRVLGDSSIHDNAEANRDVEMLVYWFRQEDSTWAMELESSLR